MRDAHPAWRRFASAASTVFKKRDRGRIGLCTTKSAPTASPRASTSVPLRMVWRMTGIPRVRGSAFSFW